MMTMNKSSQWKTLRALAVVPVIALALLAFANPKSVAAVVTTNVPQAETFKSSTTQELPEAVQAEATPAMVEKTVEGQEPAEPVNDEEVIYKSVEQMPRFPGGEAEMMKYLMQNIQYPYNAAKNDIEGRVVLQFVIEKDGHIGEVKVVRSVDEELDAEAVRVVKSMPNFTPGYQDGKPVAVWYTLPVMFKLQGDPKQPQEPQQEQPQE